MKRSKITQEQVDEAMEKLKAKLQFRLEEKGYGTFASKHEILGIINEEHHELIEAVKSEPIENVREELLDIAVGAVFGVACIDTKNIDW